MNRDISFKLAKNISIQDNIVNFETSLQGVFMDIFKIDRRRNWLKMLIEGRRFDQIKNRRLKLIISKLSVE